MAGGLGCPGTEAKAVQIGGFERPDWTGPVELAGSSRDVVHCTGFSMTKSVAAQPVSSVPVCPSSISWPSTRRGVPVAVVARLAKYFISLIPAILGAA
jgi:hypothetical protein